MGKVDWQRVHEKRLRPLIERRGEGVLKIRRGSHADELRPHRQRSPRRDDLVIDEELSGIRRILQDRYASDAGNDFLEQLEHLDHNLEGWEHGGPCDVASRSRQAGDEPVPDGVRHQYHHDRDRRRHLLGRQARWRAFGNQDVNLETDQLDRKVGEAIDPARCIAALYGEVPALDVPELAQPFAE